MKIKVKDIEYNYEAGGLIHYKNNDKPFFLQGSCADMIKAKMVESLKKQIEKTNEENDVIEIYLKSSNACNLRCTYCFRKIQNIELDIEGIKKFVNLVIDKYKCEKLKIDLTGDSEPLMEINKLKTIIEACNSIGVERNVEFVYALNSNGTVMSKEILNFLYKNSILFGFTIEGFSLDEYKSRYADGKIAMNDIIENILKYKINENPLFGVSMTLTSGHNDLVLEYKKLLKLCSAISMRIVNTVNEDGVIPENLEEWKRKYYDLAIFLLDEIKAKRYESIFPLLRSRDFFGTYLKATLYDVKRNQACLGGYKQLFLNYTGEVYVCSWGYKEDKYKVGYKDGLNNDRVNYYKNYSVDMDRVCKDCDVRYICGGECHIMRGDNEDLSAWCELKCYLIGLATYISDWVKENDVDGLQKIRENVKSNYYAGKIESYIKAISFLFSARGETIGPNEIKNEVKGSIYGPELKSMIEFLEKSKFKVTKLNSSSDDKGYSYYLLHTKNNGYNEYNVVNNIAKDLKYDNALEINI